VLTCLPTAELRDDGNRLTGLVHADCSGQNEASRLFLGDIGAEADSAVGCRAADGGDVPRRTVPSQLAAARMRPSGLKATSLALSIVSSVPSWLWVRTSQSLTVLSALPEARMRPFGLKAGSRTLPLVSRRVSAAPSRVDARPGTASSTALAPSSWRQ
jgi:hypothetical protein